MEFLGHFIDFEPHFHSIDGSAPSKAARKLDDLPTRQQMADAITAISNSAAQRPATSDLLFTEAITKVERNMELRLTALGDQINQHTSTQVTAATTNVISHTNAVQHRILKLSQAFKEFSARIVGLTSALDTSMGELALPPPESDTFLTAPSPASSAPQLPAPNDG